MKEEIKCQVFIGLGNGFDLALTDKNRICVVKRGPEGIIIGMPLCEATDDGIESVKGYIDRLRSMA